MKELSLSVLRTLVTIVEVGSFHKAGDILGRSQPAVSLQIKKLEQQVKRKLFNKVGQSYHINSEGKWLYNKAKQLLAINDDIFREFSSETLRGRMRLGIPSEFASALLPSIVGEFSNRYPDVSLDVTSSLSKHLLSPNQASQFDLILALMQPVDQHPHAATSHGTTSHSAITNSTTTNGTTTNDTIENSTPTTGENSLSKTNSSNSTTALNMQTDNTSTSQMFSTPTDNTRVTQHSALNNIEIIREDDLVWVGDPTRNIPDNYLSLVLAPDGCVYRSRVISKLKQQTQPWKITYTNPDFYGLMAAIKQGLGITALARSIVPDELDIISDKRLPALGRINICLINQDTQHPQVSHTLSTYIKARIGH